MDTLKPAIPPRNAPPAPYIATDGNANGVPTERRAVLNLRYELPNQSTVATAANIQSFLRQAELGETRYLFALYRDLTASGSHVYCELAKRKLAVLADTSSIMPADKENPDDLAAAAAIRAMIDGCENWVDGLSHLLDGTIWPIATAEKIYRPFDPEQDQLSDDCPPLQYMLKRIEPINPSLYCFRHLYMQSGNDLQISPQQWEPDVRFFNTDKDGVIQWNVLQSYPMDRMRHMIYRGHLLTGQRDNFGGPMRAIVFWWFLAANGRDWFGRTMERYGTPFPVGKTDSSNQDAVNLLKNAFSLATKIGGLVVDHGTQVELMEIAATNLAEAHEKFLNVCKREISGVIVGQTASAGDGRATGMGSSVGKLQSEVREDIRVFDRTGLGRCLQTQLFAPFLRINGLRGATPKIIWGSQDADGAEKTGKLLLDLKNSGLEPTDLALASVSEKVGIELQRAALPAPSAFPPREATALSSDHVSRITLHAAHPSDAIADRKAAVLAAAYRGALAPVRLIILNSASEEEALRSMTAFFSDWQPAKVNQITEEALQLCAAAGAVAAVETHQK